MKFLLFVGLCTTSSTARAEIVGSFPDGYPGSGYGCDRKCDDGDVNYVVRASLETYDIKGTHKVDQDQDSFNKTHSNATISMFTRTFTGVPGESSPFCSLGGDGTSGPLGPCLTVLPGQKLKVKIVNDMKEGMEQLKQHKATLEGYWKLATTPGQPNLDNIEWFGEAPETPDDFIITNEQDLPGWDASFDDTNLHFHGMQIVPHLFYPQGTADPSAEWITVKPENELSESDMDQRCFCYVFDVPVDHPQGTFFWHVHRHGSVTMQEWQGMVGLLKVGDSTSPGSPDNDLAQVGIVRDEPLILWEWTVEPLMRLPDTNTWFEGNFIPSDDGPKAVTTFLTNDEYHPSFNACVDETIHFRLLCAQTTTGSIIYVLDSNDQVIPFWVFAADGISYDKAYEKKAVIIGPGQREGVLMQFPSPGTYRVMQNIVNDFQGSGELENQDEPAAFIVVSETDGDCNSASSPIDIASISFTPGMKSNITVEQITSQVSVNFQVESQLDRVPIPQFVIDGQEFDYKRISQTMNATAASQWTLSSNMNYFHPFHIHVNPFQVQSTYSGLLPGTIANVSILEALQATNLEPANMWRDTVFIPPFGYTVIHQRFGESKAWTGKTVYHCHFLDHEDQGMISAMIIADPSAERGADSPKESIPAVGSGDPLDSGSDSTNAPSPSAGSENAKTETSSATTLSSIGIKVSILLLLFVSALSI